MNIQKCTLIFVFYSFFGSVSFPQSGPNDFDVKVAMDIMGIRQGMIIGEAGAGRRFFTYHGGLCGKPTADSHIISASVYPGNHPKNRQCLTDGHKI